MNLPKFICARSINGSNDTKVALRGKLTTQQEEESEKRLEEKEPIKDIAKDYPVTESRISQIHEQLTTFRFGGGETHLDTDTDYEVIPIRSPDKIDNKVKTEASVK
jgi:hypothetical protein